ncbi:MAG: hypothetical protein JKY37_19645 [Nannocystaceae bacterium]|nr:hypothetical protein [Nannocystaceae bacterium]
MYGVFKFLLYLGVVAGLAGWLWPQFGDHPALQTLPPLTPRYLSFGGLGLVVLALAGRSATKPPASGTGEWE